MTSASKKRIKDQQRVRDATANAAAQAAKDINAEQIAAEATLTPKTTSDDTLPPELSW